MTQSNDRLDRIERILENVAEKQDRFQADLEASRQDFDARLKATKDEMDANHEYLGSELGQLIRSVSELRVTVDQSVRQAELDRQQFARAVEQIIDLLTRQFSSNGHNE